MAAKDAESAAWLARLAGEVQDLSALWLLEVGAPFENGSCSWVAPVRQGNRNAILKLSLPHFEAADEVLGLQFWYGDPTVLVYETDPARHAFLLERCEPGTALTELAEEEQDTVVASLLRRAWRRGPQGAGFRPLAVQMARWAEETTAQSANWLDGGLVKEGLRLCEEMARPSGDDALLATDLHAGNILRAQRKPWLAIDPKPFVGDPAYDSTQHLLNCRRRLHADPHRLVREFSSLLELDAQRVQAWLFARLAADPREIWNAEDVSLARRLRP